MAVNLKGRSFLGGNRAMMEEHHIDLTPAGEAPQQLAEEGKTPLYFAKGDELIGLVAVADTVKPPSAAAIRAFRELGLDVVMLTGDNRRTANAIAKELALTEVVAEVLPQDKEKVIASLQEQGKKVAMIGDGINDAPALKKANVGIAMGGVGSDIAIDAADIALVNDDVSELPHLIALSRRMMTTIKWNMSFSMLLNFVAILLAIIGTLNPVVGALVHNAGSVLVIANSALLLKWHLR